MVDQEEENALENNHMEVREKVVQNKSLLYQLLKKEQIV